MRFLSCNGLFDNREVLWIRVVIISDHASSGCIKPSRRPTNTFYLVQSFESVVIVLSSKFIFCLFALTTACNAVAKPTMWTDFSLSFIPSLMEQSFQLWPTPRSTAGVWQFLKASILKLREMYYEHFCPGIPRSFRETSQLLYRFCYAWNSVISFVQQPSSVFQAWLETSSKRFYRFGTGMKRSYLCCRLSQVSTNPSCKSA